MNTKPIIGIAPNYSYEKKEYTLSEDYVLAIEKAGGCPIVLLPHQALPPFLDGLLLTGGGDIDPLLFGEEPLCQSGEINPRALGETLLCYFRAPGIVFLLGFASIGIVAVPLVCACQGFLLSYSLFCFALSLGRGSFPLLLALFGIRLLAVLPCTLLLGNASLDKSRALLSLSLGGGGRGRAVSYGSAYWYRFGICCVCLLFAALLELWLVPQFLLLAAS